MSPTPAYRPQCVDGRVTGEPHDIDGSHYERCSRHQHQRTLWRKARDIYVTRQQQKAVAAGEPFDREAALLAREQSKPWLPHLLGDGARGAVTVERLDVRRLRTTVGNLLDAKLPVDTAHREGEDLTTGQLNRLLTAIEKHAALVNRLIRNDRR